MTIKPNTVLKVVETAQKPKVSKKTGSGGGFGGGGTGKGEIKRFGDYAVIGGMFKQIKSVRTGGDEQGLIEIPLSDFSCRIVEEVIQDDGLQDQTFLRIVGTRSDGLPLPSVDVPSAKFFSTQANWVGEHWGTLAFVYPGNSKKDNLRAAIHKFSTLESDIKRCHIYSYAGWKKIDDKWVYLTGSGGISEEGLSSDIAVDLGSGHMARYVLPASSSKAQLKTACCSALDLLEICPGKKHIGAALLAAVARAPLGECHPVDFVLFIHGLTGSMKSAISAISLGFFGEFTARNFPANFSDTSNSLETKSFKAKDCVFVVDDFKPSTSLAESAKVHAILERFIRNTGNQAGRGRLTANGETKNEAYNRSLAIITGEDLGKGQSLLGRSLILELNRSDVHVNTLTKLQNASEAGCLTGLMSSYLKWLAPRMEGLKQAFPKAVTALRNAAIRDCIAPSHPRAPEIFANLVAGMELFIDFMVDNDLLTSEQSNIVLGGIEDNLKAAFSEQAAYQVEQDETLRFLELLRASFVAGNAHIACRLKQGPPLSRPHAWGWRSNTVDLSGEKVFNPTGDCIGWINEEQREIWVDQNAAFAVAQRLAKTQGDSLILSAPSLWRRMYEKGLIVATEARQAGTPKLAVKRVIGGRSKRVMILSADVVESE